MKKVKQNWFETLNQALESENLVDFWPLGTNISYGETVRLTVILKEPEGRKRGVYRLISIFRETNGLYERPVTYLC